MPEEKIIKKEDNLTYNNGKLFGKKKGSLVLIQNEVYYTSFGKTIFNIPLKNITNVRAKKGFGAGMDCLTISYSEVDKSKTKTIERFSFANWASVGNLDKLAEPYFKSWETAIEDIRLGKNSPATNFDEIEKLASLKDKGIITEEEFQAKKKQLLGI